MAELAEALAELAAGATEVSSAEQGETTEYRRSGRVFAVVSGDAVEFRLHPEVAEAAARTADAGASLRGPEWVRFAPAELDQHARDRIGAWFLSAWRAAAP